MAFIRNCFITLVIIPVFCFNTRAQAIYYPAHSSSLLRSTAEDVSVLFGAGMNGNNLPVHEYASVPSTGIIFLYDSTITDNSLCKIEGNGTSFLKFTAAQDNGLVFGIYQYLEELGFKFYQPGTIWQIIPALNSPYRNINTIYQSSYKYKSWFISGGHNRWIMDNNDNYGWDTYYGQNGHNWALYQRRNGMTGAYRFAGHRGDIMTGSYMDALQNNPCYVACYDGSRAATTQSVPDVNNTAAMQLWSNAIGQKYTSFKNIIFGNKPLYADHYRNFDFYNGLIGIEVPDGSQWGNSKDQAGCIGTGYESESDQDITLANFTAQKLNTVYPGKHLQLYAYSSHANIPSNNKIINNNIDIQVVPGAFQNETSAKGLLNRWYNKSANISEYQYMNIPQWGGETPMFYMSELKTTLQRLAEKNSQGVLWEASPAKFASLPFLWAANRNLLTQKEIENSLDEFCNNMFGPAASSIKKLLHQWTDDNTVTVGDFIQDNKYKLPLYFQLVDVAVTQTQQSPEIIKQRIRELKAYLHYMVLYYDWLFDQRSNNNKAGKAAAVCIYLAKINKLQLVNSYFIITDIVSRYAVTGPFYIAYNVNNGTAYQSGNLPLVSNGEIDQNYASDLQNIMPAIHYDLKDAQFILGSISHSNIIPAERINVKIGYTNGAYYPNRSEFYINSTSAGNFTIDYVPGFNITGKGYINFTVETVDKSLGIIKDLSLSSNAVAGKLIVNLPHAGIYKLSVVSKYQSSVDMAITCNGNSFYKNSAFLGNKTENYRADLSSLPGFFHVPAALDRVYFSINNSNPGGNGFANAAEISTAFIFKDNNGKRVEPVLSSINDSALFYIDIPAGQDGSFWQVFKMEQYDLCFVNINNMLLSGKRKPCTAIDFKISVNDKGNGGCLTHLSAVSNAGAELKWEIYDNGRWMYYGNEKDIDLPEYINPHSTVTLFAGENCSVSKQISDAPGYFKAREACASGAPIPIVELPLLIYPNPSTGIYTINLNGLRQYASEVIILNSIGNSILRAQNINHVNISGQPPGLYLYNIIIDKKHYTGRLIKL